MWYPELKNLPKCFSVTLESYETAPLVGCRSITVRVEADLRLKANSHAVEHAIRAAARKFNINESINSEHIVVQKIR